MNTNTRRAWMTTLSLAALNFVPAVALAQEPQSDEIVVTATGRAAALQNVPLAVTALSATQIANTGATDLRQIEQIAPSYHFFTGQSNSAGTTAYVRGIGTGGDNPGFESAVGFFIDGVYRNRSGVALGDLGEVKRVEVLRGPQGTLFGRNTSAGAISVVTAGPEFDPSAKMSLSFGSRDLREGQASVTGGLVEDKLAGRLDFSGRTQDGYVHDNVSGRDLNNKDRYSVRGQLLGQYEKGSVRLIGDFAQANEECCIGITAFVSPTSTAPAINALSPGAIVLPINTNSPHVTVTPGRNWDERVREGGVSGQLDYDFDGVKLTSISAYRDWRATRGMDVDYSSLDRAYRDGYRVQFKTLTQEVRLQGVSGKLDWLVGGFYANEKLNLTDRVRLGTQAARYTDTLTSANTGGAQIFGTSPYLLSQLGTPGWKPNLFGLAFLQGPTATGGTGNTGVTLVGGSPVPTALLIANATQAATYNALGNALAASAPLDGYGQQADAWQTDTESVALFTHNQIQLTDKVMLTLGLRYNHEEKKLSGNLNSLQPSCDTLRSASVLPIASAILAANPAAQSLLTLTCSPALNSLQNGVYADKVKDNEFTGITSLSAKVTPDTLVYASYSRGYKAGGFNLDRSAFNVLPLTTVKRTSDDLQFKPEFVNAYEVGLKWSLGRKATFNATAFYEDISDYQLNEFAGFNFQTRNISKAVSQGVELESSFRPMDGVTLAGGAVYNEAFFDSPVTFGAETLRAGTVMRQAPKYVGTGSITIEKPIANDLNALVYFDGRWNSKYRTQTINRNAATDNKAYALFNARVGVSSDKGWAVNVFAQNLLDENYFVGGFNPPEQTGTWGVYPGIPRTWGVSLSAEF